MDFNLDNAYSGVAKIGGTVANAIVSINNFYNTVFTAPIQASQLTIACGNGGVATFQSVSIANADITGCPLEFLNSTLTGVSEVVSASSVSLFACNVIGVLSISAPMVNISGASNADGQLLTSGSVVVFDLSPKQIHSEYVSSVHEYDAEVQRT